MNVDTGLRLLAEVRKKDPKAIALFVDTMRHAGFTYAQCIRAIQADFRRHNLPEPEDREIDSLLDEV